MNRFRQHPTEPDVSDDRRALAETIYTDALGYLKRGERIPAVLSALLYWFGYRVWLLPNHGFTPPETPGRRAKVVGELKALDKPYQARALKQITALGYSRPPDRQAAPKFEQLDRYCEVDGSVIRWGLRRTMERKAIFHARYDIVRLRILDRGKVLHEITYRPMQDGWDFVEHMAPLGLTDDDYRFEFQCLNSGGGARSSHPFDYAEVEGEWKRLEFQGWDWDGEVDR